MKKTILWLRSLAETLREAQYAPLILLAFVVMIWMLPSYQSPPQQQKRYSMSLTLNQWQKLYSDLGYTIERLKQSDLPSKETSYMIDSTILVLMTHIDAQIPPQIKAEQAADTTGKKKEEPKNKKN